MDNTLPSVGDILVAHRGLYDHYGIYIGEGNMIHFAAPEGAETNPFQADVFTVSLPYFANEDRISIITDVPDSHLKPFPPEEIVRRAKSRLGRCKGTYNLVTNNCEHFAYWCRYGVSESKQVKTMLTLTASFFLSPLMLLDLLTEEMVPHQ